MNDPKHTPGPWVADDNEGFSPWSIWGGMSPTGSGKPGPRLAQVLGDSEEADANARLIAAAPDLLEALKTMVDLADPGDVYVLRCARAAIAKATGHE